MDSCAPISPWHRKLCLRSCLLLALHALWLSVSTGAEELPVPEASPVQAPAIDAYQPKDQLPWPIDDRLADLSQQTAEQAEAKSWGCVTCHEGVGDMHREETVQLGCCDCHGGNPNATSEDKAHVHPRFPDAWRSSANPQRSYTLLNHESPAFVRFVNPGDLRVAHLSCGGCHEKEVLAVRKSMMTHGCMLWGAALYNNGSVPFKQPRFGESYSMHGTSQRIQAVPQPTPDEIANNARLPYLDPLPRFEVSQPGNVLRIFERGGRFLPPDTGVPEILEEPGRPRRRLSNRGLGTINRTDPVLIGLQKTRLLDPTLNFLGTNDHPGDYRSSGCTACHVVYANDRSPIHSGPYHVFGNEGKSFSPDPTISRHESGHPIVHKFTQAPPSSQCIVCHVHPGTSVMNTYLGYMWWDNETDGELMYPKHQKQLTAEQYVQAQMLNPNEAAARGLWSNPQFLQDVVKLNPHLKHTQFADFHGHGWVFRAVYKKDRKGNLLDHRGDILVDVQTEQLMASVEPPTPEEREIGKVRDGVPVHFMDIHLEKGMHCVDCHFEQDVHGDTHLYGEVRAACEIQCVDCHGTITEEASLVTSGPAAAEGEDLSQKRTPFGRRLFEWQGDKLVQNSMVEKDLQWEVVQTKHTITEGHKHYNEKSALSKTVRFGPDGQFQWGDVPEGGEGQCAHANDNMSCIACHSSWNTSCFGCHLPQKANLKMPGLHDEGDVSRNYVSYNFQTLRDDVYMLARDGTATGNRIGPCRSACAIHVTSYNDNRESIYTQQQTVSGDGLSGIAFSTNVPHTVRGGPPRTRELRDPQLHRQMVSETKMCTDCHLSVANDNNAWMATLLMQGSNYVNFIGRFCWVAAGEHGFEAVEVTERDEPQAVIGSTLHKLAFPENYREHVKHDRKLKIGHEHPGIDIGDKLLHPFKKPHIHSVQARGEYLYAACGTGGLRVFDIAFIDHKGFSERITTAPVSPLGQQFYVKTKCALDVAAPTTLAPDPTRTRQPENQEAAVHGLYGFIYVADKYEGLILIGAATLLDGNPANNFLDRSVTFNPEGVLDGARAVTIVGNYAYVCCDKGLVVVSLEDPEDPFVTCVLDEEVLKHPVAVEAQFRYAFVGDEAGMKVLDITDLARPVPAAAVKIEDVHNLYVARTYAYIAAGEHGLVIVDVENPLQPFIDQKFTADGQIDDLHDVKLGITNASEFAYLADGKHGLRVVQLTSADTPGSAGFSPRPQPRLIATRELPKGGHAYAISEGLDRDRAVDESGNQISVFGRIGARPLNLQEQRKLYQRRGLVWKVSDDPQFYLDGPKHSDAEREKPQFAR